jgi:hypothetical protein
MCKEEEEKGKREGVNEASKDKEEGRRRNRRRKGPGSSFAIRSWFNCMVS